MIIPTRFGLKFAPVPTLALEYEDDSGTTESSFKSLYVHQTSSQSRKSIKKLHVVQLPQLTSTSDPRDVLNELQRNNPVFLGPRIVKQEQVQRLLQMLVDHLKSQQGSRMATAKEEAHAADEASAQAAPSVPVTMAAREPLTPLATGKSVDKTSSFDDDDDDDDEHEQEKEQPKPTPLRDSSSLRNAPKSITQNRKVFEDEEKLDDQHYKADQEDAEDVDVQDEQELETPQAFKMKQKDRDGTPFKHTPIIRELEEEEQPTKPAVSTQETAKEEDETPATVPSSFRKSKVKETDGEEEDDEEIPSEELEYFSESEHGDSDDSF